jgi:methyltransferase
MGGTYTNHNEVRFGGNVTRGARRGGADGSRKGWADGAAGGGDAGTVAERATSFDIVPEPDGVPRSWTVSMALPGSILDNAQSPELRAALACQIARAAAIFCVDEIVVFREGPQLSSSEDSVDDLALLLSYLDTPQFLRRHLFPRSEKLRLAGLLNPLNLPNHFKKDDTPRWRDGVGVAAGRPNAGTAPAWQKDVHHAEGAQPARPQTTRYVDAGLLRLVEVDQPIEVGARATVDLAASGESYSMPGKYLYGQVVHRSIPRELDGIYWGYTVRVADSLLSALHSPEEVGYDLVIGTSERGTPVCAAVGATLPIPFALPEFQHALIVFGGVQGLEHSARCDDRLLKAKIGLEGSDGTPVADLFDFYVNTCPFQGSRTIRTEEAIPISLATLQPHLRPKSR